MPFINLKMAKGRTEAQKQEFAAKATALAAEVLQVKPEWVTIIIDEYERENWAIDGELHSVKFGEGYGTAGTEDSPARQVSKDSWKDERKL